jgi:hypothetical protein
VVEIYKNTKWYIQSGGEIIKFRLLYRKLIWCARQWRTEDFCQGCRKYIFQGTPPPVKSEFKHSIILNFKCFWIFLTNKDTKNNFFLNKPNINYFSIFWVSIYKFVKHNFWDWALLLILMWRFSSRVNIISMLIWIAEKLISIQSNKYSYKFTQN